MATKPPIECPLCHTPMTHGNKLEQHLIQDHRKPQLAKFVVAETAAIEDADMSE